MFERKRRGPLGWIHRADVRAFRSVALTDIPIVDKTLVPLTRAANHSKLWMVVAAVLALAGGRFGRRAAVRGLLSVAVTSAIANVPAKFAVRRKRPAVGVVPEIRHLRRLPTSSSFPSGHSASAFAFATGASIEIPVAAGPLGAIAAAVGYSRVYTGVHYPLDVIAGSLLGSAIAGASVRWWPVASHDPAAAAPAWHRSYVEPSGEGEGLTVVVNPSAGPALSRNPSDQIRTDLPKAKILEVTDDLSFSDALEMASIDSVAIGVAGGDGSVNAAAAVAQAQDKPLVVIPSGTLNHLARDLGLKSVDDAVLAVKDGQVVEMDVGHIAEKTFLNTASFGSYAELVDAREQLESKIGKWPALAVALVRVLRNSQPIEVEIDGVQRRIWMIFVGNCEYRPAGFAPSYRERLDDGQLDIRLVAGSEPFARLRLITSVLTGTLASSRVYERWTTSQLKVRSLQGPLRLARDGETFDGPEEFVIEKPDHKLKVFVPGD